MSRDTRGTFLNRPNILFTSPYIPFEKTSIKKDPIDYFYYRNTLYQGVFQLKQFHSWHPLHFIAQNLNVNSTVLENPTFKKFCNEIKKNSYDIIVFSFTLVLSEKLLNMVQWIKEYNAEIIIIIGGYGTSIFSENYGIEKKIKKSVDYICYGEGISYMRDYLKIKWGIKNNIPIKQELMITPTSFFRTNLTIFKQFNFIKTLGCKNACVFCGTSSHFKHQKISLCNMKSLFAAIKNLSNKFPGINSAIIYDENFLDNREEVLEFMDSYSRDPDLLQRPLLLTIFTSINSLSQYTIPELLKCGIGTIFIGVESFDKKILQKENLIKRKGPDIKKIFHELHKAGINTLGSMVIGWDDHNITSVKNETDQFVRLNPTFYQVVPLHAIPGTPLWKKMKDQNRIIENYEYKNDGVGKFNFYFKNLQHHEVRGIIFETYKKLVLFGGHWAFRVFANLLNGLDYLKSTEDCALLNRKSGYKKMLFQIYPLAFSGIFFFYGKGFRKSWQKSMTLFFRKYKLLALPGMIFGLILVPLLLLIRIYGAVKFLVNPYGEQPKTIIKKYHSQGEESC